MYKRQHEACLPVELLAGRGGRFAVPVAQVLLEGDAESLDCLLYTSDAADERSSVDLGGRRIIKKKKHQYSTQR